MNPLYIYEGLNVSRCQGNSTVECFTSSKHFTSKDLHKISVIPAEFGKSDIECSEQHQGQKIYLIPHIVGIDNVEDLS